MLSIPCTAGQASRGTRRFRIDGTLALFVVCALLSLDVPPVRAANEPIAIAEVKHEGPVDFEAEVLPLLKKNCIACHNHAAKKGDLVLETPQTIAAGGASGSAVEPGNGNDSLLIQVASRQSDPAMPPADNKVAAVALTPEELGLIRLWINEGAKGEVKNRAAAVNWQPLPPGVNPIYSVAVSADGQFAACGRANQIYIYHLPSGRFLCQLTDPGLLDGAIYKNPGVAHHDLVHSLAFSPDGYSLASGDYRVVKLWERPRDVRRLELALADTTPTAVTASPDRQWLATAGSDFAIRLWNATTGAAGPVLTGHTGRITGVRFAADGKRIFSSSEDQSIRIWDAAAATTLARIETPTPIAALTLSADGGTLVSAGADPFVRSWAIPAASPQPLAATAATPTAIAVTADQKRMGLATADGGVQIIDLATQKIERTLPAQAAGELRIGFSADGKWLATGGADAQIKIWDPATDQPPMVGNGPAAVTTLAWRPDSQGVVSGTADGKLTVWGLDGAAPGAVPLKVLQQFAIGAAAISGVAIASDSSVLYAGSEDGTLTASGIGDGGRRFAATHGAAIKDLAISADGKLLATAGVDQQIKLWNAADGSPAAIPALTGFAASVESVIFSADGRWIAGGSADHRVLIFATASGGLAQLFTDAQGPIEGLAMSSALGNAVIAASADKVIRTLPLVAQQRMAGHTQKVTSVEALSGGTHVISGSEDGTVREWDLATGVEVRKLEHGSPIVSVAVRSDGQRIASASSNHTLRLWQAADGKQLAEIRGDFKSQQRIASLTARQTIAKQNSDAAKAAFDAAEKDKTERLAGIKTAEENQTKMIAAADEAAGKAKAASDAQATADKLAADTTAQAKAAVEAKAASEKLAADLATAVALATDAAQKAQAAVDAEASAATAVSALALATKTATEKTTADPAMVEMHKAAEKAAADSAGTGEGLKALQAALVKFVEEKTAASKAATEKKAVDEKAAADAEAAAKAATDAKAAADKAATEAQTGAQTAMQNKQAAEKALADAARSLKLAEENAPLRKTAWDEVAAIAAQLEQTLTATNTEAAQHDQPLVTVAFSPDNQLLAAAGDDGIVRTYRADDGTPFETLAGHSARVVALGFTSDGALLSAAEDKTARLWDLYPVWTYKGQIGPSPEHPADLTTSVFGDRVLALAYSPDGKLLATGGGEPSRSGELKIWDVAERKVVLDLPDAHSDTIFGLDFSPTGKYLASCGADKFVRVFDVSSGKQVRSFEGHTHHVLGVTWQADGKVLASCGADSVIKIWNLESGEQQRTIAGFGKEVTSISFVGTGPMTLSTSGDKTVRLHNTADGANPTNFAGATDFLYTSRTTSDGRLIVAGGQDSVLRVWTAADGKQVFAFEPPSAK